MAGLGRSHQSGLFNRRLLGTYCCNEGLHGVLHPECDCLHSIIHHCHRPKIAAGRASFCQRTTVCFCMHCLVFAAVVPTRQAAVGAGNAVFHTVPSSISQITGTAPCPEFFYCPGGDPLTEAGLPQPCPDYLRSQPGGNALADCKGKCFRSKYLWVIVQPAILRSSAVTATCFFIYARHTAAAAACAAWQTLASAALHHAGSAHQAMTVILTARACLPLQRPPLVMCYKQQALQWLPQSALMDTISLTGVLGPAQPVVQTPTRLEGQQALPTGDLNNRCLYQCSLLETEQPAVFKSVQALPPAVSQIIG